MFTRKTPTSVHRRHLSRRVCTVRTCYIICRVLKIKSARFLPPATYARRKDLLIPNFNNSSPSFSPIFSGWIERSLEHASRRTASRSRILNHPLDASRAASSARIDDVSGKAETARDSEANLAYGITANRIGNCYNGSI